MITLHRDTLTFAFPESAKQSRSLVERRIQELASELPPTWDRTQLLSQIESNQYFHELDPAQQEAARTKITMWMPMHIEACLREFAFNRSGLAPDSFASLSIKFERTMRLPDDDCVYALPTGLGQLPLRSVDDFSEIAPASWMQRGGVVIPARQSEALWIWFSSRYPFAVRIKIGETDALSHARWSRGLQMQPQNYLVAPNDDFNGSDDVVRWLIAMPLKVPIAASGIAEDERVIQFEITPIGAESFYRVDSRFLVPPTIQEFFMKLIFAPIISKQLDGIRGRHERQDIDEAFEKSTEAVLATARQKVPASPYQLAEWDQAQTVRCFVHVCDPSAWRRVTSMNPPYPPLTETGYLNARIPWYENYVDSHVTPENTDGAMNRIVQRGNRDQRSEIRELRDAP